MALHAVTICPLFTGIPSSISPHLLLLRPAEGQLELRERAVLHKALQVIPVEVILILTAAAKEQPRRGDTLGQLYRAEGGRGR